MVANNMRTKQTCYQLDSYGGALESQRELKCFCIDIKPLELTGDERSFDLVVADTCVGAERALGMVATDGVRT